MYRKEYKSLVSDLATECLVSCYDLFGHTHTETCWGIWDTGSYRTVISIELANRLGVYVEQTTHRVNAIKSSQAAGMAMVNLRLEDLYFPFMRVLVVDFENAQGSGTMCNFSAICLVISNIILTFAMLIDKCIIMARQLRKESATGIHHVMLRGINRQDIFLDSEDYRVFIYYLHKLVRPKNESGQPMPAYASFYAYCLMNNHVHLLIREGAENLSSAVKRIAAAYARYYNTKYEHYGHLFQDRFKSEPVNDAAYFFTLLRYIHQNPVAAGLTEDVASYGWSSWQEYEGKSVRYRICNVEQVLGRMPLEELRGLVFELLPKSIVILDFDNASKNRTDRDILDYLTNTYSLRNASDILLYSRDRQRDILRAAKEYGASIRQLSRLTGISVGIIRNV